MSGNSFAGTHPSFGLRRTPPRKGARLRRSVRRALDLSGRIRPAERFAPARKRGRIHRRVVLHELLAAEELEVGVLNPLLQDRGVRELAGVLQKQKSGGETGPGRRPSGVGRKEAGMVALDRIPVDQVGEHDDRMVHVEEVLQPGPQHVGLSGFGNFGLHGRLFFLVFKARLYHSQPTQASKWRFSQ